MHPRQSVEDYLRAIQEETQQLEEQLASHKQVGQDWKNVNIATLSLKVWVRVTPAVFFLFLKDDCSVNA